MAAWQMTAENLSIANMAEGEDYATPPAMARQLYDAISHSTPTVLSGARHLIPIECPEPIGAGLIARMERVPFTRWHMRPRAIGTGAATCWLRVALAVGLLIVGFMVAREGIDMVFLMFAAFAAVGAVAATQMIETRNRRLEDIAP